MFRPACPKLSIRNVCCILLILTGAVLPGCDGVGSKENQGLSVTSQPQTIDLGDVSVEQGTVTFSITLTSDSELETQLRIATSCRCALVNEPLISISKASGPIELTGKVNLQGRKVGPLLEELLVMNASGGKESPLRVPISLNLLNSWSFSPKRVILAAGGRSSLTIASTAPSWSKVGVEAFGGDISVKEVGEMNEEGRRTFVVQANPDASSGKNRAILVTSNEKKHAVLTIPVLVR